MLSTEGLPGPVMAVREAGDGEPEVVRGPSDHYSFRLSPPGRRMSILRRAPVMASKPVAKTMLSTYSALAFEAPPA